MLKRWRADLGPFFKMLASQWRWISLGTLGALAAALSAVGLLALSGWFISAAAFAGLTLATAHLFNFFPASIGIRLFAVSRTLTRYLERLFSHDATLRILEDLRCWLYRRIEPLIPGALERYRSGDILNRVVDDVDALDNLYLRVVSPAIVAVATMAAVGVFIAFYDAFTAAAVMMAMLSAGLVLPAATARWGYHTGRKMVEESAALRGDVIDGLQGLTTLLVFGGMPSHLERIKKANQAFLKGQLKMSIISATTGALITILTGSTVILALYVAAGPVNRGELDGACLALILLAAMAAFEAIAPLPTAFQFMGRTREAARRLRQVAETNPSVAFPKRSPQYPKGLDLQLESVSFQYPRRLDAAVKDLSITIPYGQHLAVVGETGAGKTTLLNLLARFYDPQEGRIALGGMDLRGFSESDLRARFTIVDQRAHLFSATVRDNLLVAGTESSVAALWDALKAVGMDTFVKALPDGLDTWVGEAGRLLSGGQARRLAIARALLTDAPIWILDEPTEGLDQITAETVLQTLINRCNNKTLLLITHRLHHMERMDHIALMENGRIVEQGSHGELMRCNGRYTRLHNRFLQTAMRGKVKTTSKKGKINRC